MTNQKAKLKLRCKDHDTEFVVGFHNFIRREWASCPECTAYVSEEKVFLFLRDSYPGWVFERGLIGPSTIGVGGGRGHTRFDIAGWPKGADLTGNPHIYTEVDGPQRKWTCVECMRARPQTTGTQQQQQQYSSLTRRHHIYRCG